MIVRTPPPPPVLFLRIKLVKYEIFIMLEATFSCQVYCSINVGKIYLETFKIYMYI